MNKDEMKNHNCDNVVCNHNNTKGFCCLYNPDNCKYRQLQKENAELKEKNKWYSEQVCNKECAEVWGELTKAKELIRTLLLVADNKVSQMEFQLCIADAKGFLKDSEVEK